MGLEVCMDGPRMDRMCIVTWLSQIECAQKAKFVSHTHTDTYCIMMYICTNMHTVKHTCIHTQTCMHMHTHTHTLGHKRTYTPTDLI